jgi:hypothetical protein
VDIVPYAVGVATHANAPGYFLLIIERRFCRG